MVWNIFSLSAILPFSRGYLFDCEGFRTGHSSNSQWGQDWFIAHNSPRGAEGGIFVEIGAYHPHVLSNSLALEKCLNYRGLCVEPNPENAGNFRVERSCEFVNHCVWSDRKFLELDLEGDPIEASLREAKNVRRSVTVECLTLLDVLEISKAKFASNVVDVLMIDAEGSELEILKNFQTAANLFDIRMVIVEVSKIGSSMDLQKIFFHNNYEKVAVLGGDWVFRKRQ